MSAILDEIRQLPVEERLQWVDAIWESIHEDAMVSSNAERSEAEQLIARTDTSRDV